MDTALHYLIAFISNWFISTVSEIKQHMQSFDHFNTRVTRPLSLIYLWRRLTFMNVVPGDASIYFCYLFSRFKNTTKKKATSYRASSAPPFTLWSQRPSSPTLQNRSTILLKKMSPFFVVHKTFRFFHQHVHIPAVPVADSFVCKYSLLGGHPP